MPQAAGVLYEIVNLFKDRMKLLFWEWVSRQSCAAEHFCLGLVSISTTYAV